MTEIKLCDLSQLEILQHLAKSTFKETFSSGNTEEDMKNYLETAYAADKLIKQLESHDSVTYIAYCDGVPAGYVQLNRSTMQTEKGFDGSLEIQRIYVVSTAKGHGIGSQFMKTAEEKAKEWNLSYIWLGVWEYNAPAIKFYKSKGYEPFSKHTFIVGSDRQTDILMKKIL